jgi:hypothetical protein
MRYWSTHLNRSLRFQRIFLLYTKKLQNIFTYIEIFTNIIWKISYNFIHNFSHIAMLFSMRHLCQGFYFYIESSNRLIKQRSTNNLIVEAIEY